MSIGIPTPVRLLVFEPRWDGHQPEFVAHFVAGLQARPESFLCRLVLPAGFDRSHPSLAGDIRRLGSRAEVRTLDPSAAADRGFGALVREVRAFRPDSLLLFELTAWERELGRVRLPCAITGILFVQYPEIDWRSVAGMERVRRWARRRVKEWKTGRWLRRQNWRAVFLLNGERACAALNRRFPRTPVFRPLPDPVPPVAGSIQPAAAEASGARPAVVRFLFPGALSRRKGADVLLRALERIPSADAARMEVVCAGRVDARDRPGLQRAVAHFRRRRPDLRLDWQDRFLPGREFEDAVAGADWILMPYRRPEYSSGILGRAAQAGVPVIGPEDGLLGRLIREWGLGLTSRIEPRALAQTLKQALDKPWACNPEKREEFLWSSRPDMFAQRILKAIFNESGCA